MKKILRIIVPVLVVFVMVELGLLAHVFSFYNRHDGGVYDCAVVFGASVLPHGRPSNALIDRVSSAVSLYKAHTVSCIVLSGAPSAYGAHEVDVMRDIALTDGVPLADLYFDHKGFNTRQTILNLDKEKTYIMVSNDFHLARIALFAHQAQLKDWGLYASTYKAGRYRTQAFLVFRETLALLYYFFF